MNTESNATCAHEVCGCPVPPDDEFCSEHCRVHSDEDPCGCGHAHCGAHAAPGQEEDV